MYVNRILEMTFHPTTEKKDGHLLTGVSCGENNCITLSRCPTQRRPLVLMTLKLSSFDTTKGRCVTTVVSFEVTEMVKKLIRVIILCACLLQINIVLSRRGRQKLGLASEIVSATFIKT